MKKFKFIIIIFLLYYSIISNLFAQANFEIEEEGTVVCECNSTKLCVANGGGTNCRTTNDKCWKSDSSCN